MIYWPVGPSAFSFWLRFIGWAWFLLVFFVFFQIALLWLSEEFTATNNVSDSMTTIIQ